MTQAIWNGTIIADSETTSVVEGNHYFPADSIRWELLEENDRQTVCHWKGTASYYDIVVGDRANRAAAWQYRDPSAAAAEIAGHVAFGRGVTVRRTPTERDDPATSAPSRLQRTVLRRAVAMSSATSTRIEFPGSRGAQLAGRLDLPETGPRAYALFAHCFTCTKDVLAASRVAQALTGFGIAVLRFDFTGLGGSGGDFANTDFTSNVGDLVRAADYLRQHHQAPTILVGHSLGGAAVLAAAEHVPETRAVATIGAPADTEHLLHLLAESRAEIEQKGEAEVCLASRHFRIRKQLLDDVTSQPQAERIQRLGVPLLVMHSPNDETVGVENARTIFDAARHPKSFVSLDGADHLLTRPDDARFAASVLAAWASRYLDDDVSSAGPASSTLQAEEGLVVVSENGRGPYGQRITAGRHVLSADEPAPVGQDTGPSPYDLLLAGLGACTSMTLRMYAARKGWPLANVRVSLKHSRIHAKDCADCATGSGQLDRVERVIELTGELDTDQRLRLLEIADRCPVHRTLHSEVDVRTTMAPDDTLPLVGHPTATNVGASA